MQERKERCAWDLESIYTVMNTDRNWRDSSGFVDESVVFSSVTRR